MTRKSENVLVVEDDDDIRSILEHCLGADGYQVTSLSAAARLEECLSSGDVDLVILDVGLPDANGFSLIGTVRRHGDIGVILLSARADLADRVAGLEIGADDYITKPFEPRELQARVRSVLRRSKRPAAREETDGPRRKLFCDRFVVDLASQTVVDKRGEHIKLTSGEYKLLEAFVTHANRVLSRDQLLDLVCVNDAPAFDRSIDVRIGRLRRKIGDSSHEPSVIRTVRNEGYIFAQAVRAV